MSHDITVRLHAWVDGEEGALDDLIEIVLPELRHLARAHLAREGRGHTLQPTELIHDAFLKLVKTRVRGFDSRSHFYALASRLIREVLVDHARVRGRKKRGGEAVHLPLELGVDARAPTVDLETVLAVEQVLDELSRRNPRQSQVIEMRFFAGLTLREIAPVMGCSLATVERLWSVGRRRLAVALAGDRSTPNGSMTTP